VSTLDELDEIRKASEHLYDALQHMLNGDSCLMDSIWSHGATVTTMHPAGGLEVGWDEVRERWGQLARLTSDGEVKLKDQLIRIEGDIAIEVGMEQGKVKIGGKQISIDHRVTNIYHREGEAWKAVHHHTDFSLNMLDVLQGLNET
jgi:hypothetical protein